MKIGYLRVSTQEQCLDRQVQGLKEICDELHIEKISANCRKRPIYDAVIEKLNAGDTLVVWDLDRAFRSTVKAILEVEKLMKRGVHFQIVTFQIDTSSPAGMFIYTIMAAYAELEQRNLSQRTMEGLAAARRRGKRLGRPPKMTNVQLSEARQVLQDGSSTIKEIAEKFGVVPWTVTRALRRQTETI